MAFQIPKFNPNGFILLGMHLRHYIQYSSGGLEVFASGNCSCLCNYRATRGACIEIYYSPAETLEVPLSFSANGIFIHQLFGELLKFLFGSFCPGHPV